MAKSRLTITFLREGVSGDFLNFKVNKTATAQEININETWNDVFPRVENYKVPTFGLVSGSSYGDTAYRYDSYLRIDYQNRPFTISLLGSNVIQFDAVNEEWDFSDVVFSSGFASFEITNITPVVYNIVDVLYQNSTSDVNNYVNLNVETNIATDTLVVNGVTVFTGNVTNPFNIEVVRGVPTTLYLTTQETTITWNLITNIIFPFLNNDDIDVIVSQSLVGATVTAVVNYDKPYNPEGDLILEYSLDDSNWQSSPTFTGQAIGTETMYVRDQFGCKRQKEYTVTELGTVEPFSFISRANSLDFVKYEEVDDYSVYRNNENSSAFQTLYDIKFCSPQLFRTLDSTTIQLKSNFETITSTLRAEDGTETALTVLKKSNNLSRYKRMDAFYYEYGSGLGKLGIYFESGDTYDEFGVPNGTYNLLGNLPDFAIIGQFITVIGLGTFEIIDVVYDETINKKAIIIQYSYTGAAQTCVVETVYNLLPYDVYEIFIDFSIYGNGLYDVLVINDDTANGNVTYVSENIYVADEHERTLAIRYFNNTKTNRDIFYKYGVENFIRVPYRAFIDGIDDEISITKGDANSNVNTSVLYESDTFIFTDLTASMMKKVSIALSCEYVFINGVGYIKQDSIEVNNEENTNLFEVKCTMMKSNINYSTIRKTNTGADIYLPDFDIPAFVFTGDGFIKS